MSKPNEELNLLSFVNQKITFDAKLDNPKRLFIKKNEIAKKKLEKIGIPKSIITKANKEK